LATQQRETGRHPIVGVSAIGCQDFADLPEQFAFPFPYCRLPIPMNSTSAGSPPHFAELF
jgi:hypothetical protein